MANFNIVDFQNQTDSLYHDLVATYEKSDLLKDSENELNSKYRNIPKDENIVVTFVGQYSSGKSTIIKALTGESDILINSDIATEEVTPYKWGESKNIVFVDTPGINTGEKEEHDQMTMDAIEKSDLIVYCITSDLFSDITIYDFKKMAEKYKNKMFLVVNKMSAEAGNYDELVNNYSDSINRSLSPEYSLTNFGHFFIDAKDYIKGVKENNQDYIEDSYFDNFVDHLNSFIKDNGVQGKLMTPVNILSDSISNSLIAIEDNENVKEELTFMKLVSDEIDQHKRSFDHSGRVLVRKAKEKLIDKGDEIAFKLSGGNYTFKSSDFYDFYEALEMDLLDKLQESYDDCTRDLNEDIEKVMHSNLAHHFSNIQEPEISEEYLSKGSYSANNKSPIYQIMAKFSAGEASEKSVELKDKVLSLANLSEQNAGNNIFKEISENVSVRSSKLYKFVKKTGNTFGHKFKPWEAVNTTKKLANAGAFLGSAAHVATSQGVTDAIGIVSDIKEQTNIMKSQEQVRADFKNLAKELDKAYQDQIRSAVEDFDAISSELQGVRIKYENVAGQNDNEKKELIEIKRKLDSLKLMIENGDR
ncbi:MAG: GTPase [Marvinbryantia sp.]|jgi:GTPase Era involved in 16S rRNA processing